MNRLLVLVAVFVGGLSIGGAASWLILDQGERPRETGSGAGASDGFAAPRRDASAATPASDSRASVSGIRPKSFKEASHGVVEDPGDLPTAGTGKITGRVKTDKGEALAGVLVRAIYRGDDDRSADEWKAGDGPPPDDDMQTRVRKFIEAAEREQAMRREGVSVPNGEFTIDGLRDDRYSLHAYFKGYTISLEQRDLEWSARPGMWAEFVASSVIVVPIDLKLADGSVPKRATLMIQTGNNNTRGEQWRPGSPELRLGAGSYSVHATAGDHEEYRSESQTLVLKEGATPGTVSFRLNARTGIRGRVKVPKGYALDQVTIFALRYSGTAVPDESALRRGQNDWASPWNGFEFNFHDIAPGTWLIGAGTWEAVFITKSVDVTAGAIAELTLEITDTGASGLVVRVMGPDNGPVADANLRVVPAGGHDGSEAMSVRPKKDGAWVVVPKKEGAAEGREWTINVHSERLGDKVVPLPSNLNGELRIDMVEPASLDVTVTGYAGSGLEGRLRIDVRPLTGGKENQNRYYYGYREDPLGPDGRQTVKPLQPGRYRVELQYQRERWNTSPLDKVDIDVVAGNNTCSVPVPVVYSLTVLLPGESADSNLNLQQIGTAEERWNSAKIGTDGTAVFEGLVAGTYRLSLWNQKARRSRSMKVTVPSAGAVTFKEEAETALLVKVLDTEGYLASAGFQAGDTITGVDGAPFDGARPAMQILNGLMMARKELKLVVVRAGKSIEVTVDTEKFAVATNQLRSLEPASR